MALSMSIKSKVLELLERSRGESVSGEFIAGQISVSRNAVWKAVGELRKDGYVIAAETNKGYCLSESNDILSVQGMLPFFSNNNIAGNMHIYESLKSTNTTAKELAISGAEHGTIIIADHQTAGKGRYGRSFFSPPGHGIYISFILHPQILGLESTPTMITSYAAVAVCEAVEAATGKKPLIKWVNDVFLEGKKICGILTEAVTDFESGSMQWIVLGIGINFATPEAGFPEEIKNTAGSVFINEKPTITRNRLTAELINRILDTPEPSPDVLSKYKKRLLMLGKKVSVKGQNGHYEATALDIDNIGRLIVENNDGDRIVLDSGEISILM